MFQRSTVTTREQISTVRAAELGTYVFQFLRPLLKQLDQALDRRLVETFLAAVTALVMHQHPTHGLLLSELGALLRHPAQATAGTKRRSNLLRSVRWSATWIDAFLWQRADAMVQAVAAQGETPLVVWDESVLEKAESLHLEGLCPVRSTKAARLKRIKPGYFNPPGGRPIMVPGFHWLALLVMGRHGIPTLAQVAFWSTRGQESTTKRTVQWQLLAQAAQSWGQRMLHIWDRGFAGLPWLTLAQGYNLRFIVRWPHAYPLVDEQGRQRPAWHLTRGKPSWGYAQVRDARRRQLTRAGVVAVPVYDPSLRRPLWLVVSRFGKGKTPWYLLTTEPLTTLADAWRIVFAYARRWQIEMAIRFTKSELALESPRVRASATRAKLFGLVALTYALLLSLLDPVHTVWVHWLLQTWCHRTGQWRQAVLTPLYRLRAALSRLWVAHPPPILQRLDSG
jgi:hypothetical protein